MARLEVIAGRAQPGALTLAGETLLGRAQDAQVQVLDETASRRHALVREEGGRTVLLDLGSANGTRLNGEKVARPAALFDGDVIEIGTVRLRFVSGDGADRRTAVPAPDDESVEGALDPERADPAREGADAAAVTRLRLVCDGAAACADTSDPADVPRTLLGLVVEAFRPDRAAVVLKGASGALHVAASHPPDAVAPASRTLATRVLER